MNKVIPQNDNVLCTLEVNSNKKIETSFGFVYESDEIPLYKVMSIGPKVKEYGIDLCEDDIIRVNSHGSVVEIDGVEYHIFKAENIMGKVV